MINFRLIQSPKKFIMSDDEDKDKEKKKKKKLGKHALMILGRGRSIGKGGRAGDEENNSIETRAQIIEKGKKGEKKSFADKINKKSKITSSNEIVDIDITIPLVVDNIKKDTSSNHEVANIDKNPSPTQNVNTKDKSIPSNKDTTNTGKKTPSKSNKSTIKTALEVTTKVTSAVLKKTVETTKDLTIGKISNKMRQAKEKRMTKKSTKKPPTKGR